jgi:hypothetical protein
VFEAGIGDIARPRLAITPASTALRMLVARQKVQPLLELLALERNKIDSGLQFGKLFETRAERFKARCWLAFLLYHRILKCSKERSAAIFLLKCDYTCDARSFPFLHVFIQVRKTRCNPQKLFILGIWTALPVAPPFAVIILLSTQQGALPVQIVRTAQEEGPEVQFLQDLIQLSPEELQSCSFSFEKSFARAQSCNTDTTDDQEHQDPPFLKSAIQNALSRSKFPSIPRDESPHLPRTLRALKMLGYDEEMQGSEGQGGGEKAAKFPGIKRELLSPSIHCDTPSTSVEASLMNPPMPRFARPVPQPLQPLRAETAPLLPSIVGGMLWDDGSEISPSRVAELQQLLSEAQSKPLQPAQHKELMFALVR